MISRTTGKVFTSYVLREAETRCPLGKNFGDDLNLSGILVLRWSR